MRHFFHKSFVLILFFSAITIVLTLGISLILGQSSNSAIDANDGLMIWVLTALLVIILLLNLSDILTYWVNGKSQEIRAKYIVGIQEKKIYLHLYMNLNLLNFVSFIIGIIISTITVYIISSVSSYLVVNISIPSVFFTVIFNAVLLNGFSLLILKNKLCNGYMELK